MPKYTTDEICKTRLITAITMCGEIDTDRSSQYIDDDNDEEWIQHNLWSNIIMSLTLILFDH